MRDPIVILASHLHAKMTGCCLHVLLEDLNADDAILKWCIERAADSRHADCLALGLMLADMTEEERKDIARLSLRIERAQWDLRNLERAGRASDSLLERTAKEAGWIE